MLEECERNIIFKQSEAKLKFFFEKIYNKSPKIHCLPPKLYTGASKLYTGASKSQGWGTWDPGPSGSASELVWGIGLYVFLLLLL